MFRYCKICAIKAWRSVMSFFSKLNFFPSLYQKVIAWSKHPKAPYYLFGVSFAESSFFPIPPDLMLAPMSLAKPEKAWHFAFITTIASVLGGILGYFIGFYGYESFVEPYIIQKLGYAEEYAKLEAYFRLYGVWILLIAGFSPIPYKMITIAAGALNMAFLPFVLISMLGRGKRFYLVAGLMRWSGHRIEKYIPSILTWSGWVVIAFFVLFLLMGCSSKQAAPVNDLSQRPAVTQGVHIVKSGETLYTIAWRYNRDYREIATINHIKAPYVIYPGQKINLSKQTKLASAQPSKASTKAKNAPKQTVASTPKFTQAAKVSRGQWIWPTNQRPLDSNIKISNKNNGIDILGRKGQPVVAASDGEVVYSGNGLRGYGELVIIKHNERYLSAYAHNHKRLVTEGQRVKQGQKIAEIGQTDTDKAKLHFEIRQDGKPINPLEYLPKG